MVSWQYRLYLVHASWPFKIKPTIYIVICRVILYSIWYSYYPISPHSTFSLTHLFVPGHLAQLHNSSKTCVVCQRIKFMLWMLFEWCGYYAYYCDNSRDMEGWALMMMYISTHYSLIHRQIVFASCLDTLASRELVVKPACCNTCAGLDNLLSCCFSVFRLLSHMVGEIILS